MDNIPIVELLIKYLQDDNEVLYKQTLWIVGNLLTETNDIIDVLVKYNLMEALVIGWSKHKNSVDLNKENCWILSNLIATHDEDIMRMFLNNSFLIEMIGQCLGCGNILVVSEAIYALANLIACNNLEILHLAIVGRKILNTFT